MEKNAKIKQLLKILIGAAWIDGIIKPKEREYLHQKVKENNLTDDSEIKMLLSEIRPVKAEECYQWLREYLGNFPNEGDYQRLIEEIKALVRSDERVGNEESILLAQIQDFDLSTQTNNSLFDTILKLIQNLYVRAIRQKID